MPQPLLPTRFLFRFSAPCRRREPLWTPDAAPLDETYRLVGLAELEGQPAWADVRAAWSPAGLVFAVCVNGKKAEGGGRESGRTSDGLYVWIDTRDVHNVHRAGRFCHQFRFRPKEGQGSGARAVRGQGPGRVRESKSEIQNPKSKIP